MCHGVRFVSLTWCISRMNSFPVFVCFPPFVFALSILGSLNWFFAFFHWFLFLLLDFRKWLVLDYLPIVFNSVLFSFCLSPGSSAVKCLLLFSFFFLDRTFFLNLQWLFEDCRNVTVVKQGKANKKKWIFMSYYLTVDVGNTKKEKKKRKKNSWRNIIRLIPRLVRLLRIKRTCYRVSQKMSRGSPGIC